MFENTETPQDTLQAATHENALPPSRLALLGTVIKPDSVKALVRLGVSRIRSVTVGDRLGGAQVVAIDDGILMLAQNGTTRKLTLPGN